mmetsp:Transcript_6209/g.10331  ORF Transcript_6209/g.10331 Transcript_6209/m.10331 type:complete len:201 (+) Transcript_6209:810-1412(+)
MIQQPLTERLWTVSKISSHYMFRASPDLGVDNVQMKKLPCWCDECLRGTYDTCQFVQTTGRWNKHAIKGLKGQDEREVVYIVPGDLDKDVVEAQAPVREDNDDEVLEEEEEVEDEEEVEEEEEEEEEEEDGDEEEEMTAGVGATSTIDGGDTSSGTGVVSRRRASAGTGMKKKKKKTKSKKLTRKAAAAAAVRQHKKRIN